MRIRGRILTEQSEPVARAKIGVFDGEMEVIGGLSGQDGSFAMVRESGSGGTLMLRATKEGFADLEREISAAGDEELRLVLKRQGPATPTVSVAFRGKVTDQNGVPIPDAQVQIFAADTEIAGLET